MAPMTISKTRQAQLDACALWVKALRSGRYKQTTGQLKRIKGEISEGDGVLATETAYCCLGVACQLAVKEGILPKNEFDLDDGGLPGVVRKWLGLPSTDGMWSNKKNEHLVHLNDTECLSFKQIADVVEEKFMQKKACKL